MFDKNKIALHGITSTKYEMRDISQRFQLLGMYERTNRRSLILMSCGQLCDAKRMVAFCSKYVKLEISRYLPYTFKHIKYSHSTLEKKIIRHTDRCQKNQKKRYQKHKKIVKNPNTAQQKLQNPVIHKNLSQKHMRNVVIVGTILHSISIKGQKAEIS